MKSGFATGVLAVLVLAVGSAGADATLPLKSTHAATTVSGVALTGSGTTVSVQMQNRLRKNKMLQVHAELNGVLAVQGTYRAQAYVNGTALEPGSLSQECISGPCTHSATWWIDLDQAETAALGTIYYNRTTNPDPLIHIDVVASSTGGGTGKVTVVANLLTK